MPNPVVRGSGSIAKKKGYAFAGQPRTERPHLICYFLIDSNIAHFIMRLPHTTQN